MIDSFWLAVASGVTVLAVSGIFVLLWWSIRQNIDNISETMKGLSTGLNNLETSFGIKISELQREMAKDQKEMEARFTAAIKESDNRFYAYSARVSEVAEAMLKMELGIHKEFMPKDAFKEAFNDFRSDIKGAIEKVEHRLEKMEGRLSEPVQSRA